jgi:hypothetical protein
VFRDFQELLKTLYTRHRSRLANLCLDTVTWSVPLSVSDETYGSFVRFEVFVAVTMKNGVFWDVMPCGSCKNSRFGGS